VPLTLKVVRTEDRALARVMLRDETWCEARGDAVVVEAERRRPRYFGWSVPEIGCARSPKLARLFAEERVAYLGNLVAALRRRAKCTGILFYSRSQHFGTDPEPQVGDEHVER
jgi:hypothetical protein